MAKISTSHSTKQKFIVATQTTIERNVWLQK